MKKELDEKLCKDFPSLYRDRNGDMRTTAMCWGFDVGNGWFELIYGLSNYINDALTSKMWNSNGEHVSGLILVTTQVKEKYGTLRYYYRFEEDKTIEITDKEYSKEVAMKVEGAIEFAERLSAHICEECGGPGGIREGSWLVVRCNDHSDGKRLWKEVPEDEKP